MEFSIPWNALFGGMLLGLSAIVLMLFSGKVAGISGVISGLLGAKKGDVSWRITFLLGMVLAVFVIQPWGFSLPNIVDQNLVLVALAGLFVGFGTKLGNGCTSGHGIIGMGRFSKRSIVATLVFMLSAVVVVFFRQMLGAL